MAPSFLGRSGETHEDQGRGTIRRPEWAHEIFTVFPQLGKSIRAFGQNLGVWATKNQKVLDTPRTKGHEDDL